MQRVTITIDDDLLAAVDRLMQRRGYASRSEAMRDVLRNYLDRDALSSPATPCVATLSYVYDHETRALAQRLMQAQHARHDLAVASLHVHMDHDACLEVAVLRGAAEEVIRLADALTTQRGVRHASLHIVPLTALEDLHSHEGSDAPHSHFSA